MFPNMASRLFLLLCALARTGYTTGYYTFFVEDFCTSSEKVALVIGSDGANSSGLLRTTRNASFLHGRHCALSVNPPLGYGVVLTIRNLDMRPIREPKCENYVLVTGDEDNSEYHLCGYSDDVAEYKSYSTTGRMKILFHTESPKEEAHSEVSFTLTSFLKRKNECPSNTFQCRNDRCVWQGLTCDSHNNCGDRSDEAYFSRSHCGGYWPIIGLSVLVISVISLFVVFPIIRCYRQQSIDRLDLDREEESNSRSPILPNSQGPPPSYGSTTSRPMQNVLQQNSWNAEDSEPLVQESAGPSQ